jgi:hypothetical protein
MLSIYEAKWDRHIQTACYSDSSKMSVENAIL